jgi:BMFP domain-containing protein YqiC
LAFTAILIAGALSIPFIVQQQALARARAENAALKARLRDLPAPSARAAPPADADGAEQRRRDELDRLRAEAAALRTRISEFAVQAERADAADLSPKETGAAIGETIKLPQARDVGQATPAALIQSFLSSLLQGNTNRLSQLVEIDPATDPEVLQETWQEMAQAATELAGEGTNAESDPIGPFEVRLLEEQPAEDNYRWVLTETARGNGSVDTPERIKIRQTTAGWKMVFGTNGEPVSETVGEQP